jgi:hypothetical protein
MKPARFIQRTHFVAVAGLCGALALAAFPLQRQCGAQPQPASPPPAGEESVEKRASGFLDLLRFADLLSRCGLLDYAAEFYVKPLVDSENFALTDVRLRIQAESVSFALRKKCDAAIGKLPEEIERLGLNVRSAEETQIITAVRAGVTASDNPEARCLGHIAMIYDLVVTRQLGAVSAEVDVALRDAQTTNPRLVGDVLVAKAYADFATGQYAQAEESARASLQFYAQAGDVVSQSNAHMLRARFQRAVGNRAAARLREQDAANVFRDPASSPISDPEKVSTMVSTLLEGHLASAEAHQFDKAMNQVLSLLVYRIRGSRSDEKTPGAVSLKMSDAELLAYMAYYVQQQGFPAPARRFLELADKAIGKEILEYGHGAVRPRGETAGKGRDFRTRSGGWPARRARADVAAERGAGIGQESAGGGAICREEVQSPARRRAACELHRSD